MANHPFYPYYVGQRVTLPADESLGVNATEAAVLEIDWESETLVVKAVDEPEPFEVDFDLFALVGPY